MSDFQKLRTYLSGMHHWLDDLCLLHGAFDIPSRTPFLRWYEQCFESWTDLRCERGTPRLVALSVDPLGHYLLDPASTNAAVVATSSCW